MAVKTMTQNPDDALIQRFIDANPVPENQGRIYFFCPARLLGARFRPKLFLDEIPVGRAIAARYFSRDVRPGQHDVKIGTEASRGLRLDVRAGQTIFVRMTVGYGWLIGRLRIDVVDAETALKELVRIAPLEGPPP